MATLKYWAGWMIGKPSSRMLRYRRNTSVILGPILGAFLSMTSRLTAIAVRVVKRSKQFWRTYNPRVQVRLRLTHEYTDPEIRIFSSALYCLRVLRLISLTTRSSGVC